MIRASPAAQLAQWRQVCLAAAPILTGPGHLLEVPCCDGAQHAQHGPFAAGGLTARGCPVQHTVPVLHGRCPNGTIGSARSTATYTSRGSVFLTHPSQSSHSDKEVIASATDLTSMMCAAAHKRSSGKEDTADHSSGCHASGSSRHMAKAQGLEATMQLLSAYLCTKASMTSLRPGGL